MAVKEANVNYYQQHVYRRHSADLKLIQNDISVKNKRGYFMYRRFMDIIVSFIALIFTMPIILITALAIRIESSGPAFFLQERSGLNGQKFKIIKLRSMTIDAERNGPQWACKDDNRVTNVGKFIRKTRIDELPQLINVLKGDMSILGPRPERPVFVDQFSKEIPGFENRTLIKPGLTGWAQVNGGYDLSPEAKLQYDLYYIKNMSIILDLKIILKTIKVVFTGDGAR